MDSSIPLVDLRHTLDPRTRGRFIQTLGDGLAEFGFVAVIHHGIDTVLLERAYEVARQLFALPVEVKRKYETPQDGRQRGYTSFGVEHAKDQVLPDLKEFWHVGRTLPPRHPLHASGDVPRNLWPAELPAFRYTFEPLFGAMEHFASRLLDAFGEYLGVPAGAFREMVHDGNSVQRIIHYPDMGDGSLGGAVRAAAHEDINLITVLPYSPQSGLELRTRSGEWMAVTTPPDVMICDTGDMMALLTGGRIPATTHRVVNPSEPSGARYSMPFFLHPHPDWPLAPFDGGQPPVKARDFLRQRLKEIGVADP